MSRGRARVSAGLIAGLGALGFAFLVLRPRDEPRTLSEVIMMEPFVSRPAPGEAEPVPAPTPAPESPGPRADVRRVPSVPSGAFAPVTDAAVAVALDTGRGSYRAWVDGVRAGRLLPSEPIRLEEWIHAPAYDYAPPEQPGEELAIHLEVAVAPWNPTHRLVRVGLKATPDMDGDRIRRVRAELRFDPQQVRTFRRLASGPPEDPTAPGAGVDFGPGAMFTALYEVSLRMVESREPLGSLTLSHDRRDGSRWERVEAVRDDGAALLAASEDFRLAAALAGLGLRLQGTPEGALLRPEDLVRWVGRVDEYDVAGRMEFIALVLRTRAVRDPR